MIVSPGQTVLLPCQATGNPTPSIEWRRGSHPVILAGRYSVVSDNSLKITGFSNADVGVYVCVAENADGSVQSRNASLTLACKSTLLPQTLYMYMQEYSSVDTTFCDVFPSHNNIM